MDSNQEIVFEKRDDGISFTRGRLSVRLAWEREDILRVAARLGEEPVLAPGPMLDSGRARTGVDWYFTESGSELRLATSRLALAIDRATGAFSWYDGSGRLLTREPDRGGRTLEKIRLFRREFDEADVELRTTVDGVRAETGAGREVFLREAYRARLDFEFMEGEAIYGLGQHEEGKLDYRGRCQYLYQQNMKVALPSLVSSRGYGILFHGYSLMTFRDDEFGSCFLLDAVDEMDYFFVAGPEPDAVVGGFRFLTGPAVLPPRWAFGYIQSKERYKTQDELIDIVREYRTRNLPLDCVVLDWQSWPGNQWGQKSFDPGRFPSPKSMTQTLHSLGARLMVSIWPHMSNDGPNRLEMKERGFLLGNGSTYDAFDPEARALYWKQAKDGLWSAGIDAWWCDCTEPFEADWRGEVKPGPEARLELNTAEAKKYLDPSMINAYSLLHSEGLWEGQKAENDGKRMLNLTRSAYPGQQRYGTFTWSGDVAATWDTLRRQIPEGLNFCLAGLPWWTTDIGAFFVASREQWFWRGDFDAGIEDEGYRELFVRWFQYGAFLPMFRAHGTDTPREIWRFGEPGSRTYEALSRILRIRYRLLPYLYSLAGAVRFEASTMLRALVFDFRDDERAIRVEDQFMVGSALMVCPVTRPQYFGPGSRPLAGVPESRNVYLPDSGRWHDFWTGAVLEGGRTIEAPSPLEIIPVFVRAGSILPWGPEVMHSGEATDEPLGIRIYPGADGEFSLYEDSGDGWGCESGESSTIPLAWNEAESTLVIGRREGSYPGLKARRILKLTLMVRGRGELDPSRVAVEVVYVGNEVRVRL